MKKVSSSSHTNNEPVDDHNNAEPEPHRHKNIIQAGAAALWPQWLSRDAQLLIWARVSMSAARAAAGVITPIYLAIIGFSAAKIGVLFAAVAITSAIISSIAGVWSDRIGRKPFIVIIPMFAVVAAFIFIFTRSVPLIFACAAFGSFGRGAGAGAGAIGPYQSVEQAYLTDTVKPQRRTDLFGRIAFASSLGSLLGGGIIASFPDTLPHILKAVNITISVYTAYRITFFWAGIFAFIAGILALFITAQPPAGRKKTAETRAGGANRKILALQRESWNMILKLWVTNALNGLAVGFFGPFITYWFYVRYGVGPGAIGALFAIVNIAAMASNLSAGPIARKFGLTHAILFTRVLQSVLLVPMVYAPNFIIAGAIYLIRMLVQRVGLPLRQSFVMSVIPSEDRGAASALSNLPMQGTSAIAPIFAGELFQTGVLELPFELGAIFQLMNAIIFYLFFKSIKPPEERAQASPLPNVALGNPQPDR